MTGAAPEVLGVVDKRAAAESWRRAIDSSTPATKVK
jgi:hypothetical protein